MAPAESTPENVLARVRNSCRSLLADPDSAVKINEDRLLAFLQELDWDQYGDLSEPTRFPLNFRSLEDEVNFMTLMALLSFGSGFRADLHKYCDRGAADTMMFGLLGMYISEPKLDAAFLEGIHLDTISSYFSLPLDRDEELSTGIYISKPVRNLTDWCHKVPRAHGDGTQGPLKPLAEMIQRALNDCGRTLSEHNYADFGAFVLANLHTDDDESTPSAAHLVERLIATFPAFDDQQPCRGATRWFLKRAQLVASSLHRRFHETHKQFAFVDVNELTALADNVLPCVLEAEGVLEARDSTSFSPGLLKLACPLLRAVAFSSALKEHIASGQELPSGASPQMRATWPTGSGVLTSNAWTGTPWECELRAGAIVACDKLVAASDGKLSVFGLDTFLWRLGKEPRFRSLMRHCARHSPAY
ncbi:TPA: LOW QUALITY PROTEIN: hypothetical protein N0F65_005812 [Lagenidium giganteum]|uniref:Queuosine 5'-phosphate N-glycosylase/hydrolase n=1 Tax=Lagenidium giganteum TaxID=4803 RepID=A0AAV2YS76_9STRA|nr:TPA: LOW QUALITY PROTEIN: hypothetical protein N0F65_005812 [Lagenidium giganteum]